MSEQEKKQTPITQIIDTIDAKISMLESSASGANTDGHDLEKAFYNTFLTKDLLNQ